MRLSRKFTDIAENVAVLCLNQANILHSLFELLKTKINFFISAYASL